MPGYCLASDKATLTNDADLERVDLVPAVVLLVVSGTSGTSVTSVRPPHKNSNSF